MNRIQLKKLFLEWEADYAARREESAHPKPRLPSPSEIARDTRQHGPDPQYSQAKDREM
jgi:hypothetical protein